MRACDRCGERNHDDARFCGICGVSMPTSGGLESLVSGDAESMPSTEHVDAPTFGETGVAVPAAPLIPDGAPVAPLLAATAHDVGVPRDPAPHTATVRRPHEPTAGAPATAIVAPVGTRRSASLVIAVLAISALVIAGGVFIILASGSGSNDDANSAGDAAASVDPLDTTDAVAPAPTDIGPVETVPASEITIDTIAPVTEPVATVASSTVTTTTSPTEPSSTAPVVSDDAVPTRAPGDLGLTQPILDESCDGRYITFVGSAIGDQPYDSVVSDLLDRYPGTNYIWTKACPSLRQEFSNGADIYGVVYGPYPTVDEACSARAFGPEDAYVRRISTTDPQDHTVRC